jgi:hypothetical protein
VRLEDNLGNTIWSVDGITAADAASIQANILTLLASTTFGSDGASLIGFRKSASAVARSVAAALISVNGVNLADFVTDFTGGSDQTTGINNAITFASSAISTSGTIFHPGGNIRHDSQILVPGGITVRGLNRAASTFTFNGTPGGAAKLRSAWRYEAGTVNTGRFSNVHFEHVRIHYTNSVNFSGGIELNAGGGSYFSLNNVWVSGFCSYGLVLDATELCFVHDCLIENVSGITTGANIYLTNGPARSAGQGLGWTNVVTISDNQLAGGGAAAAGGTGAYGILDEGGNELTVTGNNLDGHRFAASFAGRASLTLHGNSFETPLLTGTSNVQFSNLDVSGAHVGACSGVSIKSCGFYGNMSAGSLLQFSTTTFTVTNITQAASAVITCNSAAAINPFFIGCPITIDSVTGMTQINKRSSVVTAIGGVAGAWTATVAINSTAFTAYGAGGVIAGYHSGVSVESCFFGAQFGRGGAIDVTYLANSTCRDNFDAGNSSMTHYVGVHNDLLGNTLLPPQNGFPGALGINGPTYGDTRFRHQFFSAIQFAPPNLPTYSASMTFDLKESNMFEITPTNAVAFTINNPANAIGGNKFTIWIINTTGGALGAATFGASMRLAGAWVQPATGFRRHIAFEVGTNGVMYEVSRNAVDLAN